MFNDILWSSQMNVSAIIAVGPLWRFLMPTVRYPVIFHPLPLAVTLVPFETKTTKHCPLSPSLDPKQNAIWDDKFCHHIVVKLL